MAKYILIGTSPDNVFWTTFDSSRDYREEGYTILHYGDNEEEMIIMHGRFVFNTKFWNKINREKGLASSIGGVTTKVADGDE